MDVHIFSSYLSPRTTTIASLILFFFVEGKRCCFVIRCVRGGWKIDYTLNFSTKNEDKYKRDMFVIILLLICFSFAPFSSCFNIDFACSCIHRNSGQTFVLWNIATDAMDIRRRKKNQFNVRGLFCIQLLKHISPSRFYEGELKIHFMA